MAKEIELKRCPFCGETPELYGRDDNEEIGRPYYFVVCGKCGATQFGLTTKEAVAQKWNRRFEK